MIHQNENNWNSIENHPQNTSQIEKGCNVIAQEIIAADLGDLQDEERELEQSLKYKHDADNPLLNLELVYFVVELVFLEVGQHFSQLVHRLEVADRKDEVLQKDKRCCSPGDKIVKSKLVSSNSCT